MGSFERNEKACYRTHIRKTNQCDAHVAGVRPTGVGGGGEPRAGPVIRHTFPRCLSLAIDCDVHGDKKRGGPEISLPPVPEGLSFEEVRGGHLRICLALASCEVNACRAVACQFEAEGIVAAGRHAARQSLAVSAASQCQRAITNRIASLKSTGIAGFVCCRPAERSVGLQNKSYVCSVAQRRCPVTNVSWRRNLCRLRWSKSTKGLQS